MAAPTLEALKAQLEPGGTDAEKDQTLAAAIGLVGEKVGPLTPEPVTETHVGVFAPVLVLRRAPLATVTAITTAGATPMTVPAADYTVDQRPGLVRLLGGRWFAGDYTVSYTAGWQDLPPNILLATLIIAQHLWETQRVPGAARPAFGQPGVDQPRPPMGFAVPNRAATLLEPYLLPALP